jgi:hypothetical protein
MQYFIIFKGGTTMKKKSKELQKIKGIGEVLSERLIEAGYDTFDKIVAAGEAGLKKISGLERLPLKPIIDQARSLVLEGDKKKAKMLKDLKEVATAISGQVEGFTQTVKDRFGDRLMKKDRAKIKKQLTKMTVVLDKVKNNLESRLEPAAKGLAKAEKRLTGMTGGVKEPTEVISGLKKARKALKKIHSR